MKIIFLSYTYWPPNFGGELLLAEERLQDLSKRGHQIIALTAGAEGFPSTAVIDGVQVYRSPFIGKNKIARILRRVVFWLWSILKLLFLAKIDILHFNSLPGFEQVTSNLYGRLASWIAHKKKARTVYVLSIAGGEEIYFTQNTWEHFFLSSIDHLVCVSDGLYEAVKIKSRHKIVNAVHDELFVPLPADVRNQIRCQNGVNDSDVIFTFLGSIGKRKGFDLIAEAFSEAAAQHKNWRLWVIGPRTRAENQNIDEREVAQVTEPLTELGNTVKYWGRINDRSQLAEILAGSDVFVFFFFSKGMPLSPMEAMSAGLPVIISSIKGITDMINVEGETGYYIKSGDKEALKAAMLKLAEDPALRKMLGRNARQRIVEAFSWQQHVDRWEQLYRGNLNGR